MDHYKAIFGAATTNEYDATAIKDLAFESVIDSECASKLEASLTRDEIIVALASIGSDKAPRLDGFNSFFFKVSLVGGGR